MKVGLFLSMCHIFLISRGLQKNSLLTCLIDAFFITVEDAVTRLANIQFFFLLSHLEKMRMYMII